MIYLDYFTVAKEILITLEEQYPEFVITEEDETVEQIAYMLDRYIEPELIHQMVDTDMGKGIIIGIIMSRYIEDYAADEQDTEDTDKH